MNGLDLIADNVLIQNSSITGVRGNAVFVDGDNDTIRGNTLRGLDAANAVRGTSVRNTVIDRNEAPSPRSRGVPSPRTA